MLWNDFFKTNKSAALSSNRSEYFPRPKSKIARLSPILSKSSSIKIMFEPVKSPWIISPSWNALMFSPIAMANSLLLSSPISCMISLTKEPLIFSMTIDFSSKSTSYKTGALTPVFLTSDNIFASLLVLSFLILLSISSIL